VALLAACGPGLAPTSDQLQYRDPHLIDVRTELTQASQKHDVKTVRAMLRDSVTIGGLWFADVACMKRFSSPSEVRGPALDELARCLTTLELAPSDRLDALPDVFLLTYRPGIELEARFIDYVDGPWLAWIGYAARRDVADALPTITASTLEALRIEGDAQEPLAGPGAFDELATLGHARAWLKVCIDGSGAVTGAHVREATSPRAARIFGDAAKTWKFRPFVLGSQPTPACSMIAMRYPVDKDDPSPDVLPFPLPDTPNAETNVPIQALGKRVDGRVLIAPDDIDKVRIQKAHVSRVVGAVHYCIDQRGKVVHATLIRSTGLPGYDRKLVAGVGTWVYPPYLDEGKPVSVCSSVHFIYNQR